MVNLKLWIPIWITCAGWGIIMGSIGHDIFLIIVFSGMGGLIISILANIIYSRINKNNDRK